MKQINFLKVENLELKKVINDKVGMMSTSTRNCRTSHSQNHSQSRRRVSISVDNDLEPI